MTLEELLTQLEQKISNTITSYGEKYNGYPEKLLSVLADIKKIRGTSFGGSSGGGGGISSDDSIQVLEEIRDRISPNVPIDTHLLAILNALPSLTEYVPSFLNSPGATNSINVAGKSKITCQFKITNINTSVVVRLEGSVDNIDWFNLSATKSDTTITVNDTFPFVLESIALKFVRFNFVSESGGTDAEIVIKFIAL